MITTVKAHQGKWPGETVLQWTEPTWEMAKEAMNIVLDEKVPLTPSGYALIKLSADNPRKADGGSNGARVSMTAVVFRRINAQNIPVEPELLAQTWTLALSDEDAS